VESAIIGSGERFSDGIYVYQFVLLFPSPLNAFFSSPDVFTAFYIFVFMVLFMIIQTLPDPIWNKITLEALFSSSSGILLAQWVNCNSHWTRANDPNRWCVLSSPYTYDNLAVHTFVWLSMV
jgi:hypothetical protein